MTATAKQGYIWAAASIALITIAQLLMKWGVGQLPALSWIFLSSLTAISAHKIALLCIVIGVFCYMLSMLCWLGVLQALPLGQVYPLLSISYVLVCLAAVALPWFDEPLTLLKTLGILFILLGIWLNSYDTKERE